MDIQIYAILSVVIVSLISLVGVFTLSMQRLDKWLKFLVSLAIGTLLGDVFIHLLPELIEEGAFNLNISLIILGSILGFFLLESLIHWHQHHHSSIEVEHEHHPVAYLNLVGDGFHNFVDGMIIASAYLIDVQIGIATTIAVILHEIPQEMGDFGILVYAGFSKAKALFFNFLSGIMAVLGAVVALVIGQSEGFAHAIVAVAIGSFIYISLADLMPEIHKSKKLAISQFLTILAGVGIMLALLLLE